jgi:hypothetical protein
MSAPSSAPAPPAPAAPPGGRLLLPRLLGMVALVAVGFVAVWQGFGAAGYGTDAHGYRVRWACFQLLGFGLALVAVKGWLPVRVLVALAFFASAGAVWWTVRTSGATGLSLAEAVQKRDQYRERLATATVEDLDRDEGLRGIDSVLELYPTLTSELAADYDRWKDRMWKDLRARYNQTPPEDMKAVPALRALSRRLGEVHPAAGDLLKQTDREWVSRAVGAKVDELVKAHGDGDAFDRTAPGRKALVEVFPETRDELLTAEEEWGEVTARGPVWLELARGEQPKADWRGLEKSLLARQAIDTSDARFKKARGELFAFAHDEAQAKAAAHLEAGRYDSAFGVARKHAFEWNATATILGEQRKLDDFRERYAFFAALAASATPPPELIEVAPPPRLKPE